MENKILGLLNPILESPILIPIHTPNDGIRAFMERNTLLCQCGVDWMIRKNFINNHKVRGNSTTRKLSSSLEPFFLRILNLCERCNTTQSMANVESKYPNSHSWFCSIMLQFCVFGIPKSMQKLYPEDKYIFSEGYQAKNRRANGAKQRLVRELMRICTMASKMKEPILDTELAFSDLLEVAIGIAKTSTSRPFKTGYYDPFIDKWRDAIISVESWVTGYVEDETLFYQNGRGKSVKIALPQKR